MRPHRALRRWISGGLVMLLLFMQLATAAYACPAELQALPDAAAMAAMPGCDGNMPRSMDDLHPGRGEAWVLLAIVDWRQHAVRTDPPPARTQAGPPPGAVPPGSPPIYLSLLVLRN